jgi:hypothetical protein
MQLHCIDQCTHWPWPMFNGDSQVGTGMGWDVHSRGLILGAGKRCPLLHRVQTHSGLSRPPVQWVSRVQATQRSTMRGAVSPFSHTSSWRGGNFTSLSIYLILPAALGRLSRKCGILNISQHCRPPRPVKG